MPNTIELAKNYVSNLDEVYRMASVTADLTSDATMSRAGANANEIIETAGIAITLPFVVATVVAVWLVVNEIISILENMIDIGVDMPPFLMPIVKYIKKKTEETAEIVETEKEKSND